MNTNTLAQNQSIVDEYIKNHKHKYPRATYPNVNPMEQTTNNNDSIDSGINTIEIKVPTAEELAKEQLENEQRTSMLSYENNELLKNIGKRLENIEKGMNIMLSHLQNIELNTIQPY